MQNGYTAKEELLEITLYYRSLQSCQTQRFIVVGRTVLAGTITHVAEITRRLTKVPLYRPSLVKVAYFAADERVFPLPEFWSISRENLV